MGNANVSGASAPSAETPKLVALYIEDKHRNPEHCDDPAFEAREDDDGTQRIVCTNCKHTMLSWGGDDA